MDDKTQTEIAVEDCSNAINRIDECDSRTVAATIAVFLLILARLLLRASLKDMDDRKSEGRA